MARTMVVSPEELGWSEGEHRIHMLLNVPEHENPTSPFLSPFASHLLTRAPIMAVGVLDGRGRPWTSIWGGEAGFAKSLGGSFMGPRTDVNATSDPVVETLTKTEFGKNSKDGLMLSGAAMDLMNRKRVKIFGRLVGGKLSRDERAGFGNLQMAVKVEQSIGQCPKYINKKEIYPAVPQPELIASGPSLTSEALTILRRADICFITSSNGIIDMDTNNRGGSPGFIRAISDTEIAYPEYSGNRLYQSLGNLINTPAIGMVVPDFTTGDALHLTGVAEILIGAKANALIPRSNLAIKIKLIDTRLIRNSLPLRGVSGEPSPYNPPVRLLTTEGSIAASLNVETEGTATLIGKEDITSTITRYRFRASDPVQYKPGQWVALDFSDHLNQGYSHMRDDDPTSLNDDFVRTFTVSSHQVDLPEDEFEIIMRIHGPVTAFLRKQKIMTRNPLQVQLKGFGGDFHCDVPSKQEFLPYIAGGVGITPLLGQLKEIDMSKLRLVWIIKMDDINLVLDIFKCYPGLGAVTTLFLTGNEKKVRGSEKLHVISSTKAKVIVGRPVDPKKIVQIAPDAQIWYLCTGLQLRNQLLKWLTGKMVIFEKFDY